jgi:hypothetical protein
MAPLLPVGCSIEVAPMNRAPKPFDLLVFYDQKLQALVCHYVKWVNESFGKQITTASLKTGLEDLPFSTDDVLGIVTNYKISFFRKLKLLLSKN